MKPRKTSVRTSNATHKGKQPATTKIAAPHGRAHLDCEATTRGTIRSHINNNQPQHQSKKNNNPTPLHALAFALGSHLQAKNKLSALSRRQVHHYLLQQIYYGQPKIKLEHCCRKPETKIFRFGCSCVSVTRPPLIVGGRPVGKGAAGQSGVRTTAGL